MIYQQIEIKCRNCGKCCLKVSPRQVFCSSECGIKLFKDKNKPAPNKTSRICLTCGNTFYVINGKRVLANQRFCSHKCSKPNKPQRKSCEYCSKEFSHSRSIDKFCSRECRCLAEQETKRSKYSIFHCLNCAAEIRSPNRTRKFCSRTCTNNWQRKIRAVERMARNRESLKT